MFYIFFLLPMVLWSSYGDKRWRIQLNFDGQQSEIFQKGQFVIKKEFKLELCFLQNLLREIKFIKLMIGEEKIRRL